MDPNLFHLDWDRLSEILATIVVLAFMLERALALLFEQKAFVRKLGDRGVKEPIAFIVAFLVCWKWNFDALSMTLLTDKTNLIGEAITAGVIAGGSKASLKLFRDVMGIGNVYTKQDPEDKTKKPPSEDKTVSSPQRSSHQE
jgi:hypothetical protein